MSFRDVVRRDLRESVRTRIGIATFLVLLCAVAVPAAEIVYRPILEDRSLFALVFRAVRDGLYPFSDEAVTPLAALVLSLGTALAWVVPLAGLLLSYNAVLGERQRGTIKFLLGLPNSRLAVLLGKVAARSAIVVLPVAVLVPALALTTDGGLGPLLGVLGYAVLLTLSFVTIGVAISTITTGGRRAIFLAVFAYVVFRVLWRGVQFGYFVYATETAVPRGPYPGWFYLTDRLNPIHAAEAGVAALVDSPDVFGNPLVAYAPPGSIYAADWLPAAVLVAWTVVVFSLAYARFGRLDVGSI